MWLKIKKRRSGFRLTIRNVNGINPDAGGQLATSFRLTIRNVNGQGKTYHMTKKAVLD